MFSCSDPSMEMRVSKVDGSSRGCSFELMTSAGPVITSVVEAVEVDVDPATLTDEETE
jgi:hypothetical protein